MFNFEEPAYMSNDDQRHAAESRPKIHMLIHKSMSLVKITTPASILPGYYQFKRFLFVHLGLQRVKVNMNSFLVCWMTKQTLVG